MFSDVVIRSALVDESIAIRALYLSGSGRQLDVGRLESHLSALPSSVAHVGGDLVGFAFCTKFAPDILEIANVFLTDSWRSRGVGSKMIRHIEETADAQFSSIVVVNSMLYLGVANKRPANAFYLRHGYTAIWQTSNTVVFAKSFSITDKTPS